MAEYGGQMIGQQYGVSEVGHSPAGMHRMQGQHSSPQQPMFHGQQHSSPQQPVYPSQHPSPQQPVYQAQLASPRQPVFQNQHSSPQQPNAHILTSGQMVPQQQMMMQSNQPMQMQTCTGAGLQNHQMTQQVTTQMIPQHGVAVMNQTGQMQQAVNSGNTSGQLIQTQHQIMSGQPHQPLQQQIIVTSVAQQQMMPTMSRQSQQTQQHQMMQNQQNQHQMMPASSQHQLVQSSSQHQLAQSSSQHQLGQSSSQHQLVQSSSQHQLGQSSTQHQIGQTSAQHQMGQPSTQHQIGQTSAQHQMGQPSTQHQMGQPSTQHQMGQPSTQHQMGQPSTQHQLAQSSTQHQLAQSSSQHQMMNSSSQHQMLPTSQHQIISQSSQHQIISGSPQFIQQQHVVTQPAVAQNSTFAVPSQTHLRQQTPGYQQNSPHRPAAPRFPSSSPESVTHPPQIYRASPQRPPLVQRAQIGQSSAIRQALGHIPATPAASSTAAPAEALSLNGIKLLEKEALEALIKSVDPFETVEDDVSDALKQLVEEFVDDVVEHTARVVRHRGSSRLEARDVQYVLEKKFRIFLPAQTVHGFQQNERNSYSKSPTAEAHRQRMNLIKKTLQKP